MNWYYLCCPGVLLFLLGWWAAVAADTKPTGKKMSPSGCAKIAWVNGFSDDAKEWDEQK